MEEPIKVLLVDDEDRLCEVTSKRLARKGFDVTYTNSAEMALRLLEKDPRDVIVLDVRMAGMDGLTALHEIKRRYPEIQVIMLSGYGTRYSAMRALVRDAFDFLAKPCDVEILESRIRDAWKARHQGYQIDKKKVQDIMTRIEDLVTVQSDCRIAEIMGKLLGTCDEETAIGPLSLENAPRLLLVRDEMDHPAGVLTRMDIIRAIRPEYVEAGKSIPEECTRFSCIFWSGFFSDRVNEIGNKTVREVMSVLPPVISQNANLLEAAHLMWKESRRLLLVQDVSRTVGVISDQNLFFEIAAVMKK